MGSSAKTKKCGAKDPATCRYHGTPTNKTPKIPSIPGKGVNVAAFETKYVQYVINTLKGETPNSDVPWDDIPDENRPRLFRGKTSEQIEATVATLFTTVRSELTISDDEPITVGYSRDNKDVADFFLEDQDTYVEVKLGSATDANLGVTSVMSMFPKEIRELLPNNDDKASWKSLYAEFLDKDVDLAIAQITKQQSVKLKATAEAVSKLEGTKLPEAAQRAMNFYWLGINSSKHITGDVPQTVVRMSAKDDGSWSSIRKTAHEEGEWLYGGASYVPETNSLSFKIRHSKTNDHFLLRWHHKNSVKVTEKVSADAKVGLGSSCFNCWWRTS